MKARPANTKGKKLHTPPPEFEAAEKVRNLPTFQAIMARRRAIIEAHRSVSMPSHPAPLTDDEWYRKNYRR